MRIFLIFFILCNTALSLWAQSSNSSLPDYNKALIWRGFQHQWTYNHRINRIGSLVYFQEQKGYCAHYSATGVGSDSTFATTHYTYLESPDIFFKETSIKILVNGQEGDLLTKSEKIYLELEDWLVGKDHYDVLVNGFDVKSMLKSDQIQLLRFLVEDPLYINETNQLQLTANFNLVTNCRTLECELFNNKTAYELTLHLLVLGYNEGAMEVRNSYTTRNYAWDTSIEVADLNKELTIMGQKDQYPEACLGIKGLGLVLDEEHWLLQFNNYVHPIAYNPERGKMLSHINMKFVAWNKGMENFSVEPFKAEFAKRKGGFALLDINPALLQFKQAKIKHGSKKTSLYWRGRDKSSDAPEAQSLKDISDDLQF